MPDNSSTVELADATSNLMYGIAGWLLIGLGILMTLAAFSGIATTLGTAEMVAPVALLVFAFVTVASGVFVNPSLRRRLNRHHDPSRFGRIRTVDNRAFSASEKKNETCVSCDEDITEGLVRRYREEYAIAGIPIRTVSVNYNYYCPTCAMRETEGLSQATADTTATDTQLNTELE